MYVYIYIYICICIYIYIYRSCHVIRSMIHRDSWVPAPRGKPPTGLLTAPGAIRVRHQLNGYLA